MLVAQAFISSTQEAREGGFLSLMPTGSKERVPGQPGVHRETMSQKHHERKKVGKEKGKEGRKEGDREGGREGGKSKIILFVVTQPQKNKCHIFCLMGSSHLQIFTWKYFLE